ncbi:MAG: hypothetical protein CMJ50_07815 [Planctomycetaceae bacterium]|nr:hypothetical protein [Planctomycetaceae bacterium]
MAGDTNTLRTNKTVSNPHIELSERRITSKKRIDGIESRVHEFGSPREFPDFSYKRYSLILDRQDSSSNPKGSPRQETPQFQQVSALQQSVDWRQISRAR